ncbi:hypothetical protein PpBr36_02403 [Pyricularia pennisetigena]|uniref:hypothetical protein n=1 Tax=Pyricularia pennisetigena TaxID=1578925 RepID=UPI001154489D|nr:hypothetical protein PpBr36_02403 [Pyricularia pennisetigena]TLS30244.1 hypothetical protein PpBr36_02403 [Pyricularia pennisetigena]
MQPLYEGPKANAMLAEGSPKRAIAQKIAKSKPNSYQRLALILDRTSWLPRKLPKDATSIKGIFNMA